MNTSKVKLNPSVVRDVCEEVAPEEIPGLRPLIEGMLEICDGRKCVGLAANQVGHAKRVITINCKGFKQAIINPVVDRTWGGVRAGDEGCMSFPGMNVRVIRAKRCRVSGLDAQGNPVSFSPKDPLICRALLHEVDHLNGHTMMDRARNPNLSYDSAAQAQAA